MAYRPSTKSRYDDELTLDDKWSPSQSTDTYDNSQTSYENNQTAGPTQLPPSQGQIYGQGNNNYGFQGQQQKQLGPNQQALSPDQFKEVIRSLTQEDIMFMRNWQRDSFYYRVLPITFVGCSAKYVYNMVNKRPQKYGPYALICMTGYLLGKLSYRGEFKRRLAESKSNTPYMQVFRKQLGLPPIDQFGDFQQDIQAPPDHYSSGNNPGAPSSSNNDIYSRPLSRSVNPGGYNSDQFDNNYDMKVNGYDETKSESARQNTSYDELRARNRGIIR